MKKRNLLLMSLVCLLMVFSTVVNANITEDIKKEYPASWFETPKTAEEMGITEFNQSPYLSKMVATGEIPDVNERLVNPVVIEPKEIGQYGGTHRIIKSALGFRNDMTFLAGVELFGLDPLGKKPLPSLARDYEYNKDATELTIYLRKGIKWSDGEFFNANDIIYWWEAEANNEDLNPVPPEKWKPVGWKKIEKIDDHTIKITFINSNPLLMNNIKNRINTQWPTIPAHYLKEYHSEYGNKEDINKLVEEYGFDYWYQLYGYIKEACHPEFNIPSLRPYIIKESNVDSELWVRNPYYWKVDPAGNQLPYIDQVRTKIVSDFSMMEAKVSTGEVTFGKHMVRGQLLPVLRKMEQKENYKMEIGQYLHLSELNFMFNLTDKDEDFRKVFQDVRFRRAVSLAINRKEVNDTLFYGLATPWPAMVHPAHPYFKESFVKYIDYDPERAKKLLDEAGIIDRDGDGWRDLPNGDPFKVDIEGREFGGNLSKAIEMTLDYWKEIGLNFNLKFLEQSLWVTKVNANELDVTYFSFWQGGPLDFPANIWGTNVFVPIEMTHPGVTAHWPGYCLWNQTDGEEGMEPLAEIKKLISWYEKTITTTDENERKEYCQKLLEAQADNLWTVGVVAFKPDPMVVNDNLRNYPKNFITTHGIMHGYHMETYFFEGGSPAK